MPAVEKKQERFVRPAGLTGAPTKEPWGIPEVFVVAQIFGPAVLYFPGTQPFRLPLRVSVFAIGLAAFASWLRKPRTTTVHPSEKSLTVAICYMALMIFHPNTNTLLAGIAEAGLTFSIITPLFWAPELVRTAERLERLLYLFLLTSGLSCIVAILQVYDPNRWMPAEFSALAAYKGQVTASSYDYLSYRDDEGRKVVRPPGLTDNPGASCCAALVAVFFGVSMLSSGISSTKKGIAAALAFTGVATIFLTHVRSILIILIVGMIVLMAGLLKLGRTRQALVTIGLAATLLCAGFVYSLTLGGTAISKRFSSLLEDSPQEVYKQNRGLQVIRAFEEHLPDNPLGAGLARFGMMRTYFGDENNLDSPPIWAEIQFPAWILDGGIVLLSLYTFAVLAAMWHVWETMNRSANPQSRLYAAATLAFMMMMFAMCFNAAPFQSQMGSQFWFFAGACHGITQRRPAAMHV